MVVVVVAAVQCMRLGSLTFICPLVFSYYFGAFYEYFFSTALLLMHIALSYIFVTFCLVSKLYAFFFASFSMLFAQYTCFYTRFFQYKLIVCGEVVLSAMFSFLYHCYWPRMHCFLILSQTEVASLFQVGKVWGWAESRRRDECILAKKEKKIFSNPQENNSNKKMFVLKQWWVMKMKMKICWVL